MKDNGDVVKFLKQKDYIMVNNNLGHGSLGTALLLNFLNGLRIQQRSHSN
jgi:hypothetical protein